MDGLRGFALLGILLANLRDFSGYAFLDSASQKAISGPNYALYESLQATFIDGKFYTLFSLLFGLGFAIQLSRLQHDPKRSSRTYLRRTAILLALGVIHLCLFWLGDILTFYALLGFFLYLFRSASDRTIFYLAGFMFFVPIIGYCLAWAIQLPMDLGTYQVGIDALNHHFSGFSGDLNQYIAAPTWSGYFKFTTSSFWLRIGYNLESWRMFKLAFIMLVGFWVGRQILAGQLLHDTKKLLGIAFVGVTLGLTAGYFYGQLGPVRPFAGPASAEGLARMITYMLSVFPMGFAYAAIFALVWKVQPTLLSVFCAPGRMALTNYLMQTAIGITIFYGVGFGMVTKLGFMDLTLVGVLVFSGQIVLSTVWLRYFAYGPAEWAWRCLTYGQLLPIRNR